MRLTGKLRNQAIAEMTDRLRAEFPRCLTVKDFIGSPCFHGERTLSANQVRRCLKDIPDVHKTFIPYGATKYRGTR